MVSKYKEDGVDITAGDVFSKMAGDLSRDTYDNSPHLLVHDLSRGNFRGPRGFEYQNLPDGVLITGVMDGIDTKVVIIDAAGNFTDAASNVLAMTAMDITRYGGLPLVFLNILDVASLGELNSERFEACKQLLFGLKKACDEYGFVMLGGETAELGDCVGSQNPDAKIKYNWGGCMFGVYHPNKMILGDNLRPGQRIIALRDDFRSNGISSVRKALAIKYGPDWFKNPRALKNVLAAASPSKIYDLFLNKLHGWHEPDFKEIVKMRLIVHLSGGAFESKLAHDFLRPLGLSAEINNLFPPPPIMKKCAKWRDMGDDECYSTWNGGQGAIVVVDEEDVKKFLFWAKKFGIEARDAGVITRKNRGYTVSIVSKFSKGVIIRY